MDKKGSIFSYSMIVEFKTLLFSIEDEFLAETIMELYEGSVDSKRPLSKAIFLQEINWILLETKIQTIIESHMDKHKDSWEQISEETKIRITEITDWPCLKDQFLSATDKNIPKYLKTLGKFFFLLNFI